ncbi:hypothetical protein L6Q96_10940 [Candidatus Binatia bacterium]|nr:hypothetical protein [Candidatus Binatia bacterium]
MIAGVLALLLVALSMVLPVPGYGADAGATEGARKAGEAAGDNDENAGGDRNGGDGDDSEAGDDEARGDEDEDEGEENPHVMVLPDGTRDMDKCGYCHTDDNKTLERSPEETCTNCHDVAIHGGSLSHSQATPEDVKERLASSQPGGKPFPLTEKGAIYCATCHLSHDADGLVDGHKWLPGGCEESTMPFSVGVRKALEKYRDRIASPEAAHFVKEGTRLLRLPACDGQLCAHCHGDLR